MSRYSSNSYRRNRRKALARDGRCQFVECAEARPEHLTAHHKRPLSEGGRHKLKNLLILCWAHHDLIHQPTRKENKQ